MAKLQRPESSLCGEERGVAGGDVAGARDVPLPRPRVLAVGAALQQKLPGALAVDPHVHRPVVVAVPVHLRPETKQSTHHHRRHHTIRSKESNQGGRVWGVPWLGDAGLLPGGVEDIEALLRRSSHLGGGAVGERAGAGATSEKAKLGQNSVVG